MNPTFKDDSSCVELDLTLWHKFDVAVLSISEEGECCKKSIKKCEKEVFVSFLKNMINRLENIGNSSIVFLHNPGIGDTEWLKIHEKFLDVIAYYKNCHVDKYSVGPPCGGYCYRVEYQDKTIIEQLEKIGLKASDYAEQLITEGKVKLVVPKTKSNGIF